MSTLPPENAEFIEMLSQPTPSAVRWKPTVGSETLELLGYLKLKADEKERLQDESIGVVSKCLPPSAPPGSETGLVIGYIQSGKTMSFTTVAALARDNGYRLIIVITGITTNLFSQSNQRLERDLKRGAVNRRWWFFQNPRATNETIDGIANAIDWDMSLPINSRKTVLITVMKNARHLEALLELLCALDRRVELMTMPALVIDDEADQASLNNLVKHGRMSSIYARILEIRKQLPHHSFLQYTATPQALLLINLIDVLSPNFAELLSPGTAYTGGKTFFEKDFRLIKTIPSNDMPTKDSPLTSPPKSLFEAMRLYFIGAAVGYLEGSQEGDTNRSMMVHPSKTTSQHGDYVSWVRQIKTYWEHLLEQPDSDHDKQELLNEFYQAYLELKTTVEGIPDFSMIIHVLRQAIKETQVTEANAARGKTPQPDWEQIYSHIVVGGEVLNRGYTIQGLTVTYMPRGKGVGNADTLQQRARWFGYKAQYLGYCRVYLDSDTEEVYRSYVEHEESIRSQLHAYQEGGLPLKEWRRAFFLDPRLHPTRQNVLDKQYTRGNFANKWFVPTAPHDSAEAVVINKALIDAFVDQLDFYVDKGSDKRTEMQRHLYVPSVDLYWVYETLLVQFQHARPKDSYAFTGVLLQLERYFNKHSDVRCAIYRMSKGAIRIRTLSATGDIPELFQGANPKDGSIYPGDEKIRGMMGVTIQIHNLNLQDHDTKALVAENVPALAIWLPKDMGGDWLVQEN